MVQMNWYNACLIFVATFIFFRIQHSFYNGKVNSDDLIEKPDDHYLSDPINKYLSVYAPYRGVAPKNITRQLPIDHKAMKLVFLQYSGTHYPDKNRMLFDIKSKIVDDILKLPEEERFLRVTKSELEAFEKWNDEEYDKRDLTDTGIAEIKGIARRWKSLYPELFGRYYDSSVYKFLSDNDVLFERNRQVFVEELFGTDIEKGELPPYEKSLVFTLLKICRKMIDAKRKNEPALKEKLDRLVDAENLFQAIGDVERKWNTQLTNTEASAIYDAYAHETAWKKGRSSVWRSALEVRMAEILDYLNDFEEFYVNGYQANSNHDSICLIVQEMIQFFENEKSDEKVIAYFATNAVLPKMLAYLGLIKDDGKTKHLAENPDRINPSRAWKTSKIMGFGSNLALLLSQRQSDMTYFVSVLHQEINVAINGCPYPCSLRDFKKLFYSKKHVKCNFQAVCGIDNIKN